ncbi:MAG TPA: hypothetical protein VHN14_33035 [Kofleriaceae bacterium]|nr:hypothetical protein [Kofleriaceae bacterium]
MIDQATGGALRAGSEARCPLTFREFGRRGLAGMPILLVLSDLMTGRQLDDRPTVWQAMFHPDIFRQQIEAKLGVAPRLLYKRRGPAFPHPGGERPARLARGRAGVRGVAGDRPVAAAVSDHGTGVGDDRTRPPGGARVGARDRLVDPLRALPRGRVRRDAT